MKMRAVCGAVVLLIGLYVSDTAQAGMETVMADDFTTNGVDRVPGGNIAGTTMPVGGATWTKTTSWNGNPTFSVDNTFAGPTGADAGAIIATIPTPIPNAIRLSAELSVNAAPFGWLMLGDGMVGNMWGYDIALQFDAAGKVAVAGASGASKSYGYLTKAWPVHIELTYDPATLNVGVVVSNWQVGAWTTNLSASTAQNITQIGLASHTSNGGSPCTFDNVIFEHNAPPRGTTIVVR